MMRRRPETLGPLCFRSSWPRSFSEGRLPRIAGPIDGASSPVPASASAGETSLRRSSGPLFTAAPKSHFLLVSNSLDRVIFLINVLSNGIRRHRLLTCILHFHPHSRTRENFSWQHGGIGMVHIVSNIISLDADDLSQGSNDYVGKLSSDFLGTNFTIYDSEPPHSGAKPSSSRSSRRFASNQISPRVPAGNFEVGRV